VAAAAKAKAEAAAKATARAKLRQARAKGARRKAAARRRAVQRARRFAGPPASTVPSSSVEPTSPVPAVPVAARPGDKRDLMTSPLVRVLLLTAAALALISVLLAALPLGTLERLLASEANFRTEQLASFVDGHRLDIAVAGVGTLLVAAVAALPTVTG
jgi:hypothetical protein